jgi:hypothetical protein
MLAVATYWETIKWIFGLLVAASLYPLIIFLLNVGKHDQRK